MFRPASALTVGTAGAVYQAGLAAIRAGQAQIDLGELTAVDSSAVATLIGWRRTAQQQGKTLSFINMPASLHSLAVLYGVAELLGAAAPQAASAAGVPAKNLSSGGSPHH